MSGTSTILLGALLVTGMGSAQAQQVTSADYQRAASMLGDRTGPLVDNNVRSATWLDDGSLVYALAAGGKTTYQRLDPRTGAVKPAFDAQALADAMNLANPDAKRPTTAAKLPPLQIKRDADGRLRLSTSAGTYSCAADGCSSVPMPRDRFRARRRFARWQARGLHPRRQPVAARPRQRQGDPADVRCQARLRLRHQQRRLGA